MWAGAVGVQANSPFSLGRWMEEGTQLSVPGALGALTTPFLLLRLQVPRGWEETPESIREKSSEKSRCL